MQYDTITRQDHDGMAVVTLNRPEVMNALNTQMRAEITHAIGPAGREALRRTRRHLAFPYLETHYGVGWKHHSQSLCFRLSLAAHLFPNILCNSIS